MEGKQKFSINKRLKSFGYAFTGLRLFFSTEHNGRIHAIAAIFAVCLSWYLQISRLEWLAILLIITIVISLEIINTAIEKLSDALSPNYTPAIKMVKDLAAGAVLVAALAALVIGAIILLPKLLCRIG